MKLCVCVRACVCVCVLEEGGGVFRLCAFLGGSGITEETY